MKPTRSVSVSGSALLFAGPLAPGLDVLILFGWLWVGIGWGQSGVLVGEGAGRILGESHF